MTENRIFFVILPPSIKSLLAMKTFKTTGKCLPDRHYMVNIDRQVGVAVSLIDRGEYFCINRGRQFGKTTTLAAVKTALEAKGYTVFSISFEGIGNSPFTSLETLLYTSLNLMQACVDFNEVENLSDEAAEALKPFGDDTGSVATPSYIKAVAKMTGGNKTVLLIDEVDQAGNYFEFVQFLGTLRSMYLKRDTRPTFQSVVLAGVYDIKNLKLKMRPEEQHQYNSPWNIAMNFDADMSLHADGIAGMLAEYKADHHLTFDETVMAQQIYDYTNGYPYLVSRLCQILDEQMLSWDREGLLKAVNQILTEPSLLFQDMAKKLNDFPTLKNLLKSILYTGERKGFAPDEHGFELGMMFNFLRNNNGFVAVYCRLMETRLYNMFISEDENEISKEGERGKTLFTAGGRLNMRLVLEKFVIHYNDIYSDRDVKFVEEQGRKMFLLYLRPIINGVGNYYVEAHTRDDSRTDVVVDYLGEQFVVELKIWRGNAYNEQGEHQLAEYLDYYHLSHGYLVSFCFNKTKQPGVHDVAVDGRTITEALL